MKTIIIFVLGLLSWLLLTNYQVVYSKVINFTNPVEKSTEVVANVDSNISPAPEEKSENKDVEEELRVENSNADNDKASTFESEIKTLSDDVTTETGIEKDLNNNEATVTYEKEKEKETVANNNSAVSNQSPPVASKIPSNHPRMQAIQPHSAIPMFHQNMMNPAMMNPGMFMNPMAMMTPMMMSMMGPMMNPSMMMNPNAMMNHPMNTMTHPQNINSMMMTMDPKMMFSMFGQPSKEYLDGKVPEQLPVVKIPGMPTQTYQNWPVNKVSPGVSREAKKNAFQTAMAVSPLSMHDMMGIMADKMQVEEGVSWDDAVEAMKLRANEINFKFVGSSKLWKEIEAVTGKPSTKVEMFRFCDAAVARRILDVVPEFIIFLPCKIALMEDGEGKLWVMTMDWDVSWLDYSQNPNNHLAKNIREDAQRIRDNLHYIMEGAATGDF